MGISVVWLGAEQYLGQQTGSTPRSRLRTPRSRKSPANPLGALANSATERGHRLPNQRCCRRRQRTTSGQFTKAVRLHGGGSRDTTRQTAPPSTSMVERGSTVRVRQRALEKASKWPFCCLNSLRPPLERPPTCPQDLSPTFEFESGLGLNRGIGEHRAPP
jgi:hypothetical protein